MASTISLELRQSQAHLTLQNPPQNVITLAMMDELSQALTEIDRHPEIVTIVISGEGNSFSAGVDVAAHTPDNVAPMLENFHGVVSTLIANKKITVAAVHGICLGGGAELAMICDLVYTTGSAQWGFPEIRLGCYPPVACTALAALIGQKKATELILTGKTINGVEAATLGLATHSAQDNELDTLVKESLQQLAKLSPAALALAKKANYMWDSIHFDKGLARAEKIYLEELIKTDDAREGITAFLEKRAPVWKAK